ncbi:succinylglutamate desuccinylase/aspartoacylase family protein [Pseudenhygromyxa sp. WMMC2535]|uniref:succinylglutamate desuccinylase/aspartoacylase family protein n=1 Tax=Pseudenhygromyxa sp. WMMC2535 TaxID=2712867 RepID=UPI0031F8268C
MSNHREHLVQIVESFDPRDVEPGSARRLRLSMVGNGLGGLITVPVVVLRGQEQGPTVGITAAIHGNELNGMRVVQNVIEAVDPRALRGTIIAVPVVNVPGYLNNTRHFNDGYDLNRMMPGKRDGTMSQVYCHRFMSRVVCHLDYLLDLHTASFGRINTFYVRADLANPVTAGLARCLNPQIVLHNTGADGTLRGAAQDSGVQSITVEIGNPNRFQDTLIRESTQGVFNALEHLGLRPTTPPAEPPSTVVCERSYWMYTQVGGVLEVLPDLGQHVRKGELVGRVRDIFGDMLEEYFAPEDGVIIGRSVHPVNQTGSRIIHLGIEGEVQAVQA